MSQKDNDDSHQNQVKASKELWKSFETLKLIHEDRFVVMNPSLGINDNVMNAALHLLRNQFPEVKGLQNISNHCENSLEPIDSGSKFVRIINEGNSNNSDHWIVISNMVTENPDKEVRIYDSNYSRKHKYTNRCNSVIVSSMNNMKNIKVIVPYVTQEYCCKQSGVYSIAFAHILCCGGDPSQILFDFYAPHLRNHLIECFENDFISTFPMGKDCSLAQLDPNKD